MKPVMLNWRNVRSRAAVGGVNTFAGGVTRRVGGGAGKIVEGAGVGGGVRVPALGKQLACTEGQNADSHRGCDQCSSHSSCVSVTATGNGPSGRLGDGNWRTWSLSVTAERHGLRSHGISEIRP